MLACSLALLLGTAPASGTAPLAPEAPVHLGISLKLLDRDGLTALERDQQDPGSPDYHRWLSPSEFGQRFGQPGELYDRAAAWLRSGGFRVTSFSNRAFLEGSGTCAQVAKLLGVHLARAEGQPASVHVPDRSPELPAWLKTAVLNISGLDTRQHLRHRVAVVQGPPALGPQDLRRIYDLQPLFDAGYVGQGQQLVVLSTAESPGNEASAVDINYFLNSVSDVKTPFLQHVLPNPQNDVDNQINGGLEFDLDVEMQSVGVPGAESITLEVSPASEVFTTGANDIVSTFPTATSVSVSLGNCEQAEQQAGANEAATLQQAIQQGVVEGQTWSAATGDNGADDCRDGKTVSVDFPASIPEVVAMGGAMITNPVFDQSAGMMAHEQEVTWNDGSGAGGGGLSILYTTPSYQVRFPFNGSGRSVPDLALIAGNPGAAADTTLPGQLVPIAGTSVASPLSAGFFALIASRVGCRLGDAHAALYALGYAQFDGGTRVYNDITAGTVTLNGVIGPDAGPGYDSATGWGSLDVAALASAWPPCARAALDGGADGGLLFPEDAGPGAQYTQCGFLACDGGASCTTLSEGPSSCVVNCDPTNPASCETGTICSSVGLFQGSSGGACVPGCLRDSDCGDAGVCATCEQTCIPAGNSSGKIGDACASATDCPSGAYCSTSHSFTGGYCTETCQMGATGACGCPSDSVCGSVSRAGGGDLCLAICTNPGQACERSGYYCQPRTDTPACLPACRIVNRGGTNFDTCTTYGSTKACDLDSGICGGPQTPGATDGGGDAGAPDASQVVDAGPVDAGIPDSGVVSERDAGGQDAGQRDAGQAADAGTTASSGGCGCSPEASSPDLLLCVAALAGLLSRRRRVEPR